MKHSRGTHAGSTTKRSGSSKPGWRSPRPRIEDYLAGIAGPRRGTARSRSWCGSSSSCAERSGRGAEPGGIPPPIPGRYRRRSMPPSARRPDRPATVSELAPEDAPRPISRRPRHRIGGLTSCSRRSARGAWASVYMAEQEKPVRRKVALKIIKPGMDSEQVVARFEAERQALALMDHPNIARVLDAGTTDTGRPYFVMELVHGVPITEYCDERPADAPRAAGAVRPGLPGDPARPSEGDHPPRHQAVERAGDAVRRQAGAQGDRLRRRQGDRPAADRADACSPSSARSSARSNT